MTIEWTEHHTELQQLMKKEIDAMRALLGNLHQEEILILQKEMSYWNQLMEERGHLIQQLSHLRQNRISTTETLESLTHSQNNVPLEQLLPSENENSWELLALRDQMFALLDRMNLQCSRNEMLTHLAKHHQSAPQPLPERKAKISIATLPDDDYNNRHAS